MAKYEMFEGKDDEFYFRLRADNGETILKSEGYVTKDSCENGIDSVRENAPDDENYERETTTNGEFYFNLITTNGRVIATSETYITEISRDIGIESVKDNALDADVDVLT